MSEGVTSINTDYSEDVFRVHRELVVRYISLLPNGAVKDSCRRFIEVGGNLPADAQGRFVGRVQEVLFSLGLSTIDKERLISTPMFREIYERHDVQRWGSDYVFINPCVRLHPSVDLGGDICHNVQYEEAH